AGNPESLGTAMNTFPLMRRSKAHFAIAMALAAAVAATFAVAQSPQRATGGSSASSVVLPPAADMVPDPKQVGGEPDGIVRVANLVYAGVKSSQCFSDHFLVTAEKESAISTSRRFHAVKLSSDEMFNFPLVIMTGEGTFELTEEERANFRQFVERGGFLLASAGC